MFKILCFLLNLIVIIKSNNKNLDLDYTYSTILDHDNNIQLKWYILENSKSIRFKVTILNQKENSFVFGFGFSERGHFSKADICLFEIKNSNLKSFRNVLINQHGFISSLPSNKNHFKLINFNQKLNRYEFEFERKMNTCDDKSYLIESGTIHLVYFISYKPIINFNQFRPEFDSDKAEMKQAQLIKSKLNNNYSLLKNSKYFDILNANVKIPNDETTYWCLVHKLNEEVFEKKHHIIGFEGLITPSSKGIVHHMELFLCMFDPPNQMKQYNGPCKSEQKPTGLEQCRKVIAAWAMGAQTFIYPEIAGSILGGSYYKSPYLVLEIHYDNPNMRNDIVDSSGLRIFYQKKLRKYDAGIMEIGLEYNTKNSIPPKSQQFHMHGHCLGECTKYGLNNGPIYVFASQLHTHLTGRKVWTSQIRGNKVIDIINSDNHYDQMFQEIRMLPKLVKIKPGDTLINTCVFETMDRTNMTVGGYSIRDEMCVNYMHYYPMSKLEVCKSSISDSVLNRYFTKMNEIDYSTTNSNMKSIKENFDSIRWTPLTKSILSNLYDIAPISLSCNSSDGKHIERVYQNGINQFTLNNIDNLNDENNVPINYNFIGNCDEEEEEN